MIGICRPTGILDGGPPSVDRDVAKLRLELRHLSLEALEEAGFVRWDREADLVRKGPRFDER